LKRRGVLKKRKVKNTISHTSLVYFEKKTEGKAQKQIV
jgi:hypothetical protein